MKRAYCIGAARDISSGGELLDGVDQHGNPAKGYKTAHFTMKRSEILSDNDSDYTPTVGALDDTVQPTSGSTFIMTDFIRHND